MEQIPFELRRLVERAYAGRVVLVAGADIVPGTSSRLAEALSASFAEGKVAPAFADACASLDSARPLDEVITSRQFLDKQTSALRMVGQVPWAAVLSSVPDTALADAIAPADAGARRLRHLYANEPALTGLVRNPSLLPFVHLGRIEDRETRRAVPATGPLYRRQAVRFVPALLARLPEFVGPAHAICVAGVGRTGLISWELLADVLQEFAPENVFWVLDSEDALDPTELRDRIPGAAILEGALDDLLALALADDAVAVDARARRATVLQPEDVLVTVRRGKRESVIGFTAAEVREFRRHLLILPDFAPPRRLLGIDRREEFLAFLAAPRHVPNWQGIAEGCVFVREAYRRLLNEVNSRARLIEGDANGAESQRPRSRTRPIFLAGPPAGGRTVGLHWIGFELRQAHRFCAYLVPSSGSVDVVAVEKFVRLAESRGAPLCVLLADHLERHTITALNDRLLGAGRRCIIVAAAPPLPRRKVKQAINDDLDRAERQPSGFEIELRYELTSQEQIEFPAHLNSMNVSDADRVVAFIKREPKLFALLFRVIPEARSNIQGVLVDEYLRLWRALRSCPVAKACDDLQKGSLADQVREWCAKRLVATSDDDATDGARGVDAAWPKLVDRLPNTILLFSRFEEPLAVDVAFAAFPSLLLYYSAAVAALEDSGLFHEVSTDAQHGLGLLAINHLVAEILLTAVLPSSESQLDLFERVLMSFRWREGAEHQEENPDQARLLRLLRAISPPNGPFQQHFGRTSDHLRLAGIYRRLREEHGFRSPQLMRLEGTLLRLLGRQKHDPLVVGTGRDFFKESLEILEEARTLLEARSPSVARNAELSFVLTAIATTIGSIFYDMLRKKTVDLKSFERLANEVAEVALNSLAYRENYYALDIVCWTNKDFFDRLRKSKINGNVQARQLNLLENIASALDAAMELEKLPDDQLDQYKRRRVELAQRRGELLIARDLAEDAARQGQYAAICTLARDEAIDLETGELRSRGAARAALADLRRFEPMILQNARATAFLHRLWLLGYLGNKLLEEGPHAIAADVRAWQELEMIVRARIALSGGSPSSFVTFWLAVALAHQGDLIGATARLNDNRVNSMGFARRRLKPLVVLADPSGRPLAFHGVVSRRDPDDTVRVSLPTVGDVVVQRRHQGASQFINARRGDEVAVHIGLSYWDPLGLALDLQDSVEKSKETV